MEDKLKKYAICYPLIDHPMKLESNKEKKKYVDLIWYYANRYFPNDPIISNRLFHFQTQIMQMPYTGYTDILNVKKLISSVLRTRILLFRILTYRYVFMFDIIYLLAPADEELTKTIYASLKEAMYPFYRGKMDQFMDILLKDPELLAGKQMITLEMALALVDVRRYMSKPDKSVLFTATMSAGKSTLINAFIGKELSFAKKAACTSSIMYFHSAPLYYPTYQVFASGELVQEIEPKAVREYTKGRDVSCTINGYFEAQTRLQPLTLIDTPGINSSRNPEHKAITREELQKNSAGIIVYVIPVETYGSDDDYFHLKYIREKVSYKKILFVINMMDNCDLEDDSVSEIVDAVQEHLVNIGFETPIVCPLSAKAGLLMKRVLAGASLSDNDMAEVKRFYEIFSDQDMDLSGYYPVPSRLINYVKSHDIVDIPRESLETMYLRTGLPGFEMLILDNCDDLN